MYTFFMFYIRTKSLQKYGSLIYLLYTVLAASPLEDRIVMSTILHITFQRNKKIFFPGALFLGKVKFPSSEIVINIPWTFTLKENFIGPAVSEILYYKHTDRQILYYFYMRVLTLFKIKKFKLTQLPIILSTITKNICNL